MPTNTPTTPSGFQYPPPQLTAEELMDQLKALALLENDLARQFYAAYQAFMSISDRLQDAQLKANVLRGALQEFSK